MLFYKMSSALDAQAILTQGQLKKAGRMGASALARKAGLGKRGQGLAGKAGEMAAGYAAGKARGQIKKLIGFEKEELLSSKEQVKREVESQRNKLSRGQIIYII